MSRKFAWCAWPVLQLCGVLCFGNAAAQDAMVRATLADDSVWIGERATVVVELLVPGYFASAVRFDLPDPEGVLLMPPTGHPVVGNETIGGTSYTVQRHELSAWSMRAGKQSIPALAIRFTFKRNPLDTDQVAATATTSPIPFTVTAPPGAENLGTVISARNLELVESWSPEPGTDGTRAGDAFVRTITFTASEVPGMLFPPFPVSPVDGLSAHVKRQVLDHVDGGSLTGVRTEQITYVCQQPGRFIVPAARFTWFDPDAERLRSRELPARTLNVIANPSLATADAPMVGASFDRRMWGAMSGGLVLILLGWLAARQVAVRRLLAGTVSALRPVHLKPLNPGGVSR